LTLTDFGFRISDLRLGISDFGFEVTLVSGTRLGPHEIVWAIGAGRMGEV